MSLRIWTNKQHTGLGMEKQTQYCFDPRLVSATASPGLFRHSFVTAIESIERFMPEFDVLGTPTLPARHGYKGSLVGRAHASGVDGEDWTLSLLSFRCLACFKALPCNTLEDEFCNMMYIRQSFAAGVYVWIASSCVPVELVYIRELWKKSEAPAACLVVLPENQHDTTLVSLRVKELFALTRHSTGFQMLRNLDGQQTEPRQRRQGCASSPALSQT